jgi:hypothetical protein
MSSLLPIDAPLIDDTNTKISKDRLHEQDLWNELAPDADCLLVMKMVVGTQNNTKGHLEITKYCVRGNVIALLELHQG